MGLGEFLEPGKFQSAAQDLVNCLLATHDSLDYSDFSDDPNLSQKLRRIELKSLHRKLNRLRDLSNTILTEQT